MNIVITGVNGFVGKNLSQYLIGEFNVAPLSVRYQPGQRFELNTDVVIHLSGKAHDLKNVSCEQDYYEANFELTKQLYDAFLHSDAKQFIYMSSVKAVADSFAGILTENVNPEPLTIYGKSKQMAEIYIQSQPLPEGKTYYILRPCMIHGPGNKGNLNLLYRLVRKGIPYPLASFENKRSFLGIGNLCFLIRQLILDQSAQSGIYHVADDKSLSTNDVISLLSRSLNKKPNFLHIPQSLVYLLAKIGTTLRLPFNTERLSKLTENYVVSNDKIKKTLNVSLPFSAEQGLYLTAESFKNNSFQKQSGE